MKRSIYIVLSGIITSAAVLGWTAQRAEGPASEAPQEAPTVVPDAPEVAPAPEPVPEAAPVADEKPLYGKEDLDSFQGAVIALLAEDEQWRLNTLVAAYEDDMPEALIPALRNAQSDADREAAFAPIRLKEELQGAEHAAIIDLQTKTVVGGDALSADVLAAIEDVPEGKIHAWEDGALIDVRWHCVNEETDNCVFVWQKNATVLPSLDATVLCAEAASSRVHCTGEDYGENGLDVDLRALLSIKGCDVSVPVAVWEGVATQGDFEHEGRVWNQVSSGDSCHIDSVYSHAIAVAAPVEVVEPAPDKPDVPPALVEAPKVDGPKVVPDNKGGNIQFTPLGLAMSLGAGLIMILLGFACTTGGSALRREEERLREEKNKLESVKNELARVKKDCTSVERERDELCRRVGVLEADAAKAKTQFKEVCQEAEQLKQEVSESKSKIEALEADKKRLSEAIAPKVSASRTIVDAHAMDARVYGEKKTEDLEANVDANRITAQADGNDLEDLAQGKSGAFFDSLSDDGWDEIADSFDSIFATPKKDEPSAGLLDNGEPSLGMTNFLKEVQDSNNNAPGRRPEKRTLAVDWKPSNTETGLVPVGEPGLKSSPKMQPQDLSISSLHGKTVSGLASIPMEDKKSVPPTPKRSAEDDAQSFKPAPSWTGKSVGREVGMDENSLFNALKRRAKDVSQMDMPAATRAKSGASGMFDYNRSLSKSGVFSVTGSRVDIDPASDTEYFKSLYEKFTGIQRECGESTDKFTLEQFVTRLAREKERLMQTYHCRNVRFTVYAKDGKASLKATPQK